MPDFSRTISDLNRQAAQKRRAAWWYLTIGTTVAIIAVGALLLVVIGGEQFVRRVLEKKIETPSEEAAREAEERAQTADKAYQESRLNAGNARRAHADAQEKAATYKSTQETLLRLRLDEGKFTRELEARRRERDELARRLASNEQERAQLVDATKEARLQREAFEKDLTGPTAALREAEQQARQAERAFLAAERDYAAASEASARARAELQRRQDDFASKEAAFLPLDRQYSELNEEAGSLSMALEAREFRDQDSENRAEVRLKELERQLRTAGAVAETAWRAKNEAEDALKRARERAQAAEKDVNTGFEVLDETQSAFDAAQSRLLDAQSRRDDAKRRVDEQSATLTGNEERLAELDTRGQDLRTDEANAEGAVQSLAAQLKDVSTQRRDTEAKLQQRQTEADALTDNQVKDLDRVALQAESRASELKQAWDQASSEAREARAAARISDDNWYSVVTRGGAIAGAVGILILLLQIFVNATRYNARLGEHYAAQANALRAADGDQTLSLRYLEAMSTTPIDFGKTPASVYEKAIEALRDVGRSAGRR